MLVQQGRGPTFVTASTGPFPVPIVLKATIDDPNLFGGNAGRAIFDNNEFLAVMCMHFFNETRLLKEMYPLALPLNCVTNYDPHPSIGPSLRSVMTGH